VAAEVVQPRVISVAVSERYQARELLETPFFRLDALCFISLMTVARRRRSERGQRCYSCHNRCFSHDERIQLQQAMTEERREGQSLVI
jgi:hypothetical protein